MASQPIVALCLSKDMSKRMFRAKDLERLHSIATVKGPLPNEATVEDYHTMLSDVSIAITGWGTQHFSKEILAAAPALKLIAHSAGTVKWLFDESAYDRNIRITTSAAANAVSVGQFTVAMMVSMLKQIPWIFPAYARGDKEEVNFRRKQLRELQDIEVGIIGASRVGKEVIRLLKSYPNVTVKCYDPYLSAQAANELGVEQVSLEDACRCEVVSIHAPAIPETKHMFNARILGLLPDHCVLINTSRGSLVDEEALVNEVRRRPLYVSLDVTDPEPPLASSPLRNQPNILLTPHIAGALNQACKDMGALAIDEVTRFINGEKLQHEVTREMLPTQA